MSDTFAAGHGIPATTMDNLAEKFRFSGVDTLSRQTVTDLFEAEYVYCRGRLDEALALANALLEDDRETIRVSALTYRMVISVAREDVDQAYEDYTLLEHLCREGIEHGRGDMQFGVGPYVLSAMIIEKTLLKPLFELPDLATDAESFPYGLRQYFGYHFALRQVFEGDFDRALGLADAFKLLVQPDFPESQVYLYLTSAIAHVMACRPDEAREEYTRAWELGQQHGIIMPFVETYGCMLGLQRSCFDAQGYDQYRKVEAMARKFRRGRAGLQQRCGMRESVVRLTQLECDTMGLAALGWSNRQIAQQLGISENTVRNHLTSGYQKMNIHSRKELRANAMPAQWAIARIL